jgi:hypothetical protein
MATYIERTDEGFLLQLHRFSERISIYAAALGITPVQIAAHEADKEFFTAVFEAVITFRGYAESLTNYKNLLRYGNGSEVLGAIPTAPVISATFPALTAASAQKRFADLIKQCTASPNYTLAIGEDLGIEAPVSPFVPGDGKPEIKAFISDGGQPGFRWKKGKYQGVEIWINTGTGWKFLDKDFNPDFVDKKTPLPAAGTSAVWKYKAIYLYKGEQAGQWSEELNIPVYGAV